MSELLYIHVKDWETHQPRSDRPNLPWIRLETALLGNDAWLGLEPADTKLLVTIWLLSQRYGNGCVIASLSWLQSQANLPVSNRYQGLKRLVNAGLVTLSTTKGTPTRPTNGGLEEKRGEEEPLKALSSTLAGKDRLASPQSGSPIPTNQNGQPRKPSPTELDNDLRSLSQADLHAPVRDAKGFLC